MCYVAGLRFYLIILNLQSKDNLTSVCNQVPNFIARIMPKNLRGGFTAIHQTLVLIVTITCLLQLIGLSFIPESPRWLAKIGREKECEAALQCLRGRNADISFQRKYARSLIVGVGLMVLQQFGGVNGISFYASAIFISAGFLGRLGTIRMVIVHIQTKRTGINHFSWVLCRIWNYEEAIPLNSFDNHDYPEKGITKHCLVNELDDSLLLSASGDGNIRIWKDYNWKNRQNLVTAFSSNQGHKPGVRSLNAIVDWQQQSGNLEFKRILMYKRRKILIGPCLLCFI
ncbi:Sugar transporter ERD6-like 5 [Morella rubra]|uniref:Sugar transporter ERD6-like 5 n=1 Tax=Morella rubra TaxID=262757 RepID=A0A6A1V2A7_9ROSI|nr:Sugar transporter ERD6-like 5 [Morella rubra]KAB1206842.1 Sugar transporter ERD6-like 5 [Morella rubra]